MAEPGRIAADSNVVLVSGAMSGIGKAVAIALADSGYKVYASGRNLSGANAGIAAELRDRHAIQTVELDVTSDPSVDAAVAQICAASGRIDVLRISVEPRPWEH